MRRIGTLVAILSVLLLAGLGLLVARALDSVERERAMRHEVLAERVFDELEEQLSGLIEREEARPFLQYRFFYVPEGQVGANPALTRSPLSHVPKNDWLLGWFQLDPGGGVTTPLEPDDPALAEGTGWSDDDALRSRIDRLREVAQSVPVRPEDRRPVADAFVETDTRDATPPRPSRMRGPAPTITQAPAPKPRTPETKEPSRAQRKDQGLKELETDVSAPAKKSQGLPQSKDPYGIGSLNKGAMRRADRQQKITKSTVENLRTYQNPQDNSTVLRGEGSLAGAADADTNSGAGFAVAEPEPAVSPEPARGETEEDEARIASEPSYAPEQRRKERTTNRKRKRSVPAPVVRRPETSKPAMSAPTEAAEAAAVEEAVAIELEPSEGPQGSEQEALVEAADPGADTGLLDDADTGLLDARPNETTAERSPAGLTTGAEAPTGTYARARELASNSEETLGASENSQVDVEISPLVGHRVDDDVMVLFRTVRIGEVTYVQGLALLLPALTGWLEEQALDGAEVQPFLELAWNGAAQASRLTPDFSFAHTFAEPFTELAVTSYLTALPEPRGSGRAWILQLTALLVLVGLIGLVALWRMVSVVVHFAERRNNFVAAVSHELKTPLTAIRMYAEMLRDGYVLSEEKRGEYYETMAAESERLSRLIQNVLELSRLEKGANAGGDIITGDVRPVLEEAVRVLERHAQERGFSIRLEAEEDLPPARYERDGLLQVLINLVDNGIKFSKGADAKEVVIEALPKGGSVVLRVRDHGPGVPARQLGSIFQPFYRGERELTRRTKGTGIGLALVKGIVDRMGGNVSARNHPEGGFEVRVALAANGPRR